MNLKMTHYNEVINLMVALRIQHAELDSQIETLQPTFIQAYAALDISQLEHKKALTFRQLTCGQWTTLTMFKNMNSGLSNSNYSLETLTKQQPGEN